MDTSIGSPSSVPQCLELKKKKKKESARFTFVSRWNNFLMLFLTVQNKNYLLTAEWVGAKPWCLAAPGFLFCNSSST